MAVKDLYKDGIWDAIVNHPDFDIGIREFKAAKRFMPYIAEHVNARPINILHLGIGDGREIPLFVSSINVREYVLNDICHESLLKVYLNAKQHFSRTVFYTESGDIEKEGRIEWIRSKIQNTLFVLIGNAVIFANRKLDHEIERAMREDDLIFVTAETPHEDMFRSYMIEPAYALLSQNGRRVTQKNTYTWYDESDQCLKISSGKKTLLASYKPTPKQLQQRMEAMGLKPVVVCEYKDIHMVAGLFRK